MTNSGTAQGPVTAALTELLTDMRDHGYTFYADWLARALAATSTTPDAEVARRAMGEAYDRVDGLLAEFGRVDDAVYLARLRRLYRDLRAALDALPVATSTTPPAGLDARIEALRQRDSQSEPDDYWTGWNDALDRVLALRAEQPK